MPIPATKLGGTALAALAAVLALPPMPPAAAAAAPRTAPAGELPYPDLGGVTLGRDDVAFMADDTVLLGGKHKRLDQLSAAERAKVRASIRRSQLDLVRDRARLPRELAEARREADRARSGELRREHLRAISDLRRDLAEVDSEARERRPGEDDPAERRQEILRDLREAERTDIGREERLAIADYDPARMMGEIASAERQYLRMLARLDQLDRQ